MNRWESENLIKKLPILNSRSKPQRQELLRRMGYVTKESSMEFEQELGRINTLLQFPIILPKRQS